MRWMLILTGTLALATGLIWWVAATRTDRSTGAPIVVGTISDDEKHRVTPEMERASAIVAGRALPSITLPDELGRPVTLDELAQDGPLVVIFIKDGCPCSTAAAPFFQELHEAYGDGLRFFGVIDGNRSVAQGWVEEHGTPFPVLADPDVNLARALGATNSAYVAVVGQGGRVDRLWPGFSQGMLQALSEALARRAGVQAVAIDTTRAPEALYTGCPFPL